MKELLRDRETRASWALRVLRKCISVSNFTAGIIKSAAIRILPAVNHLSPSLHQPEPLRSSPSSDKRPPQPMRPRIISYSTLYKSSRPTARCRSHFYEEPAQVGTSSITAFQASSAALRPHRTINISVHHLCLRPPRTVEGVSCKLARLENVMLLLFDPVNVFQAPLIRWTLAVGGLS